MTEVTGLENGSFSYVVTNQVDIVAVRSQNCYQWQTVQTAISQPLRPSSMVPGTTSKYLSIPKPLVCLADISEW